MPMIPTWIFVSDLRPYVKILLAEGLEGDAISLKILNLTSSQTTEPGPKSGIYQQSEFHPVADSVQPHTQYITSAL